jgi:hypothetical protein
MGVLDDAIREHLELKRQHGASDEELARQEAEALGPARREFPEAEASPDAGEPEAAERSLDAAAPDEALETGAAGPALEEVPAAEEPYLEPEPEPYEELPSDDGAFEDSPALEDEPAPSGAEPCDEDVLEETPEFLQETPEHERLWFEQRPPRDFDFD